VIDRNSRRVLLSDARCVAPSIFLLLQRCMAPRTALMMVPIAGGIGYAVELGGWR
jgi:hypothetical protein